MNRRIFDGELARRAAGDDAERRERLKVLARALVGIVRDGLIRDGSVRVHGFGTFHLRPTAARSGINPRTGERIRIPARQRVLFRPAEALRQRVDPEPAHAVALAEPQASREAMLSGPHQPPAGGGIPAAGEDTAGERPAVAAAAIADPTLRATGPGRPALPAGDADGRNGPDGGRSVQPVAGTCTAPTSEASGAANEPVASEQQPRGRGARWLLLLLLLIPVAGGWWYWQQVTQAPPSVADDGGQPAATEPTPPSAGEEPATRADAADAPPGEAGQATTAPAADAAASDDTAAGSGVIIRDPDAIAEAPVATGAAEGGATESGATASGDTASGDTGSGDTASGDTASGAAADTAAVATPGADPAAAGETGDAGQAAAERSGEAGAPAGASVDAVPGPDAESTPAASATAQAPPTLGERLAALPAAPPSPASEAGSTPTQASAAAGEPVVPGPTEPGAATAAEPYFAARDYTVVAGDTLWGLAERHYVNPYLWPHIYNHNRAGVDDPDRIEIDQRLWLPTLQGEPAALTAADRTSIAEGYLRLYRFWRAAGRDNARYALIGVRFFDAGVMPADLAAAGAGYPDDMMGAIFHARLVARFDD